MIAKGFDPLAKSRDGCYPFHFFVERGVQSYNVAEDATFLDLIYQDLMRGMPLDFAIPQVLVEGKATFGKFQFLILHSRIFLANISKYYQQNIFISYLFLFPSLPPGRQPRYGGRHPHALGRPGHVCQSRQVPFRKRTQIYEKEFSERYPFGDGGEDGERGRGFGDARVHAIEAEEEASVGMRRENDGAVYVDFV